MAPVAEHQHVVIFFFCSIFFFVTHTHTHTKAGETESALGELRTLLLKKFNTTKQKGNPKKKKS